MVGGLGAGSRGTCRCSKHLSHKQFAPSACCPRQSYSFNYMGQKLGRRVRVLMFAALLRQVGAGCSCGLWAGWLGGQVGGEQSTSGSNGALSKQAGPGSWKEDG